MRLVKPDKGDMKARELMIGDWVYSTHNRQPEQVREIREHMVMLDYNDLYDYDEIEPIPLTGEILERNGFKLRKGCTSAWDWCNGETSIHVSGNHTCPIGQTLTIYVPGGTVGAAFSSNRAMNDLKIRGVHELQHALNFCHINKKIKVKED